MGMEKVRCKRKGGKDWDGVTWSKLFLGRSVKGGK